MIDLARLKRNIDRLRAQSNGPLIRETLLERVPELGDWIEAALPYLAVLLREMDAHPRQKFINKALTPEHLRSLISQIHPSPARRES